MQCIILTRPIWAKSSTTLHKPIEVELNTSLAKCSSWNECSKVITLARENWSTSLGLKNLLITLLLTELSIHYYYY